MSGLLASMLLLIGILFVIVIPTSLNKADNGLEKYIISNNPVSTADVDRLTKEYADQQKNKTLWHN